MRQPGVTIVYDGECPFCAAYVRMLRLREAAGPVRLVDARGDDPVVAGLMAAGIDLDDGMAVIMAGDVHHGAEAMTVLSLLTTRSGAFNRAMRLLFARPGVARALYPPLVAGRNLALRVLGRGKLGDTPRS